MVTVAGLGSGAYFHCPIQGVLGDPGVYCATQSLAELPRFTVAV
jgi:hypothetical protein